MSSWFSVCVRHVTKCYMPKSNANKSKTFKIPSSVKRVTIESILILLNTICVWKERACSWRFRLQICQWKLSTETDMQCIRRTPCQFIKVRAISTEWLRIPQTDIGPKLTVLLANFGIFLENLFVYRNLSYTHLSFQIKHSTRMLSDLLICSLLNLSYLRSFVIIAFDENLIKILFIPLSYDVVDVWLQAATHLDWLFWKLLRKKSRNAVMRYITIKPRKSLHLTNPIDVYTYSFRFVDIPKEKRDMCIRMSHINFNLLTTLKFKARISVMRITPLYQVINIFSCGSMAFCVSFSSTFNRKY